MSRQDLDGARARGWCWLKDDPECTYPDEREWLEDHIDYQGYGVLANPSVQEFQWAIPAPSTFVVAYEEDESPELKVFESRAEAEAFVQTLPASENVPTPSALGKDSL